MGDITHFAGGPYGRIRLYGEAVTGPSGANDYSSSEEPGERADLMVLSHDPTVVAPAFLCDILVEQSCVEGQCRH